MGKLSDDIQALVDRCPVCEGSGAYRSARTGTDVDVICMHKNCSDLLTIKRRVIELEAKAGACGPAPAVQPVVVYPDLAMPLGLSELGQRAYQAIIDKAEEFGLMYTGGCKVFYSPKEWRERGEEHGLNSELIIVYDGADIGHLFSLDKDTDGSYRHIDVIQKALEHLGLYTEECTCWYSAVYKIG